MVARVDVPWTDGTNGLDHRFWPKSLPYDERESKGSEQIWPYWTDEGRELGNAVLASTLTRSVSHGSTFQVLVENLTHRMRSTAVMEVAEFAAFPASHKASGMTGTVVNLTGDLIVD